MVISVENMNMTHFSSVAFQASKAGKENLHVRKDGQLVFGRHSWRARIIHSMGRLFGRNNLTAQSRPQAMDQFKKVVLREHPEMAESALKHAQNVVRVRRGHPLTVSFVRQTMKKINEMKVNNYLDEHEHNPSFFNGVRNRVIADLNVKFPEVSAHLAANDTQIRKEINNAAAIVSNNHMEFLTHDQMEEITHRVMLASCPSNASGGEEGQVKSSLPKDKVGQLDNHLQKTKWDNGILIARNKEMLGLYRPGEEKFEEMIDQQLKENYPNWKEIVQQNKELINGIMDNCVERAVTHRPQLLNPAARNLALSIAIDRIFFPDSINSPNKGTAALWKSVLGTEAKAMREDIKSVKMVLNGLIKNNERRVDEFLPKGERFVQKAMQDIRWRTDGSSLWARRFMAKNEEPIRRAMKSMVANATPRRSAPMNDIHLQDVLDMVAWSALCVRRGDALYGRVDVPTHIFGEDSNVLQELKDFDWKFT